MKTKFILFTSVFVSIFTSVAFAAPMPGTSSSALVAPDLGIYRSPLGFEIQSSHSGWKQSEAPKDNKFMVALYKEQVDPKKKKDPATLTVRVDKIEQGLALDKYVQRWQKEYPKYGFDVLGSKPFVQGKDKGYVLDIINKTSKRQMRQVVFMKAENAVILTCRDEVQTFSSALKQCNQIIRSFSWNN